MLRLLSPPPDVRLVNSFARPLDSAVAAARTCYAAKGIVTAEEVGGDGLPEEERLLALRRREELAKEIFQAGHHTCFQHTHFQFAIDRVSRQALWAFFHAHPFYNSEQVSQRYVKVGKGAAVVPELDTASQAVYEATLALQEAAYRKLTDVLKPIAEDRFFRVFKARARQPEKWKLEIRRKAQEAARYVLPVATWARLYHTISALTLLRYHRLAEQLEAPSEIKLIVDGMVHEVLRVDPDFAVLLERTRPVEETPEFVALQAFGGVVNPVRSAAFREEFDESLGGRISKMVGFLPNAEELVAGAVREVLGVPQQDLPDDQALSLAADPASNPLLGETLNLSTIARLTRVLHHATYTFRRKISHSADSQDQRHRMTPASRPVLAAQLGDEPDVIFPQLVEEEPEARSLFVETMASSWEAIRTLRRNQAPEEAIDYLLPNATAVRYTETADFSALRHKHAMRLCFNAQEEIWRASLDEARQVADVHPRLGQFLMPPCGLRVRAQQKPFCPEGRRFCGIPVWTQRKDEYRRLF